MSSQLRYRLRDVMWLALVLGLVIGWTIDHRRNVWKPDDDDLWIPLVEQNDRESIQKFARVLDAANISHVVRDNRKGTVRILVTLPNMDAASKELDEHPQLDSPHGSVTRVNLIIPGALDPQAIHQEYAEPLRQYLHEEGLGNVLWLQHPDQTSAFARVIIVELADYQAGVQAIQQFLEEAGAPSGSIITTGVLKSAP